MDLRSLPSDVILAIFSFLPAEDILLVAKTSRQLYSLYETSGVHLPKFKRIVWFRLSDELYFALNRFKLFAPSVPVLNNKKRSSTGLLRIAGGIRFSFGNLRCSRTTSLNIETASPFIGNSLLLRQKDEGKKDQILIVPSTLIFEWEALKDELSLLFNHVIKHNEFLEIETNLPLDQFLELVTEWQKTCPDFDYTNVLNPSDEEIFFKVVDSLDASAIGILHKDSTVSRNFFLHEKIRTFQCLYGPHPEKPNFSVDFKFASALDDEMFLAFEADVIELKHTRTKVTLSAINKLLRQWAIGERRIYDIRIGLAGGGQLLPAALIDSLPVKLTERSSNGYKLERELDGEQIDVYLKEENMTLTLQKHRVSKK